MTVAFLPFVHRFEARALGSPLRLIVHEVDRRSSERLWDEVLAEFAAVDASLSRFRDDSEITRLNRHAGSDRTLPVSRRLSRALVAADRARRVPAVGLTRRFSRISTGSGIGVPRSIWQPARRPAAQPGH